MPHCFIIIILFDFLKIIVIVFKENKEWVDIIFEVINNQLNQEFSIKVTIQFQFQSHIDKNHPECTLSRFG